MKRPPLGIVLFTSALAAACSSSSADGEAVASSEDALRVPSVAELLGDIAYGQTRAVDYAEVPSLRAFKLAGKQGDAVDLWVRSPSGGDARAWILRADGKALAKNDDADASTLDAHVTATLPRTETYYVVFRDANYEDNAFTVALAGGGGAGAAVPPERIGTTFTAKASCSFLVEWGDYKYPTCGDFGYGWGESVDLTFRVEGTPAKPELVAGAFSLEKVVATWGEKRTIGWPETRIPLDPSTGRGRTERWSRHDRPPGPGSFCYGVAKGTTTWSGSVSGDAVTFELFESMQTNSCCKARRRTASCALAIP
jgi:hypothetical protein